MNWNDYFYVDDDKLKWKVSRRGRSSKDGIAGTVTKNGYVMVCLDGKMHYAHRIVWEMHNGTIPNGMHIDHIDHNRENNSIENLRLVTRSENMRNQKLNKKSSSGVVGVSWRERDQVWIARICIPNGKNMHIGSFRNFDDAVSARKDYERKFNYHKNHGA